MSKSRKIVARGLTASSRGSTIKFDPVLVDEGMVTAVEWFDNSTVLTLTISLDLKNHTIVEVYDK